MTHEGKAMYRFKDNPMERGIDRGVVFNAACSYGSTFKLPSS
jgi:hypothetical protein